MSILDTEREYKRPVEEVARALLRAKGATGAAGGHWSGMLADYRRVCSYHPDYASGHSLVADAMRESDAAITRLIELGFISELGLVALKAENASVKTG